MDTPTDPPTVIFELALRARERNSGDYQGTTDAPSYSWEAETEPRD